MYFDKMGNNGGVEEIISHALLSLAKLCSPLIGRIDHAFVMHFSYSPLIGRAHALLSLAELVMHFSCTTKVQP